MITNKKFRDTRTGEIVEQFDILDIKYMEEVEDEDSKAYTYICNFVNDYCKDDEDKKEFFDNLLIYLDEEIEKEKECNQ